MKLTPQEGDVAQVLVALGCPKEKSAEMARQLEKRARQLSQRKSRSYEDSLAHLLGMMKKGWAAKARGF